ncbi:hypothetical protein E4U47_006797 [Claviceps purpurea]|nr:hypothetical protein E4U47_006797 [Claviceps purpurea]
MTISVSTFGEDILSFDDGRGRPFVRGVLESMSASQHRQLPYARCPSRACSSIRELFCFFLFLQKQSF